MTPKKMYPQLPSDDTLCTCDSCQTSATTLNTLSNRLFRDARGSKHVVRQRPLQLVRRPLQLPAIVSCCHECPSTCCVSARAVLCREHSDVSYSVLIQFKSPQHIGVTPLTRASGAPRMGVAALEEVVSVVAASEEVALAGDVGARPREAGCRRLTGRAYSLCCPASRKTSTSRATSPSTAAWYIGFIPTDLPVLHCSFLVRH